MIRAKDLREFRPICCYDKGGEVTLDALQAAIESVAQKYDIPVAFGRDCISSGSLLDMSRTDCIVLYHPRHRSNYFRVAISIKRQGTMTFVSARDFGKSKNLQRLAARGESKEAFKGAMRADTSGINLGADSYSQQILKSGFKALMSLGGSRAKQEEENSYYAAIKRILDEVLS